MSETKGMTHYSLETKLQAVHLHEEEGLTYAEVAAHLGLRKAGRIKIWVRQYRQEGEAGLTKKGSGRPPKGYSEEKRMAQLERENALLKKFQSELRKAWLVRRNIGSSSITEEPTP
jgi:transposase-like protein